MSSLSENVTSVQIQTVDYCNRKCEWCPNSKMDKKPDTLMDVRLLYKVLMELRRCNYQGQVKPYLMGEPLADKRMLNIINLIHNILPENAIHINTNGDYLDYDLTKDLLRSGVSTIHVNHYDDRELMETQDEVFPQVYHFGITSMLPGFYNRAGHIEMFAEKQCDICGWVSNKMAINYQGEVILCCSDYNYEVVFGNINEQHLDEIYDSDLYTKYREYHQQGRGKELKLCKSCNRIKDENNHKNA